MMNKVATNIKNLLLNGVIKICEFVNPFDLFD